MSFCVVVSSQVTEWKDLHSPVAYLMGGLPVLTKTINFRFIPLFWHKFM